MKKVFFQKLGIFAVSVITLGLLIWAMFIPESNVFWNTYLGGLFAGYIYFLVKFFRDMWGDDYGNVLAKTCVTSVCMSIFGPTVQMLGLLFSGVNLMGGHTINSLPCQLGISWALLLVAFCLIYSYFDSKDTNKPIVNWFILFSSIWLLSLQVGFADEILKVFGYTLPAWAESIFSVVYPVIFILTALLAFGCIIVGIFKKD